MRSAAFFVLASAASVLAQEVGNYTSSLNMTINPGTVEEGTRQGWCDAQYNTCRTLCDDNTRTNNCEESDLSWTCTCASNNSMPGLEYYSQTMPFFICKELFAQCQRSTDSRSVQDECAENIDSKCYENPPPKAASSDDDEDDDEDESSTTAEATTSTTTGGSSEATNDEVSTTTSEDFAAPTLMPGNGVAAVAAIGVLAYML